ncbi:hypothetical protein diail_4660 [Diaporthe ilicicola]|nr:hypothetical protein diail_4660 [Diaporthe ilicicola]
MEAPLAPASYHYEPLGENSIRLLKIRPELKNGHIACTVKQFDNDIPRYDALSYFWGDGALTRTVYVDDTPVDIHESLWEFLDQMRRSQRTEHWIPADNWIWTDFLCLDQNNNEEIGQQIPHMGQIYSEAERTISWLGCKNSSWVARPDGSATPSEDLEKDLQVIAKEVSEKGAVKRLMTLDHQNNIDLVSIFPKI